MPQHVQKQKAKSPKNEQVVDEETRADDKARLKQEIDDLLDEIDGVLEENAEDFVKSYIQKGGE